jgi:hypothetical protein
MIRYAPSAIDKLMFAQQDVWSLQSLALPEAQALRSS